MGESVVEIDPRCVVCPECGTSDGFHCDENWSRDCDSRIVMAQLCASFVDMMIETRDPYASMYFDGWNDAILEIIKRIKG